MKKRIKEPQRYGDEHQQKIHEYVVAFLKENPDVRLEEWAARAAVERELRRLFRVPEIRD